MAGIVAETFAAAKDAAELVWLDVDEADAAVTTEQARANGAIQIYADVPGNSYGILEYGDLDATDSVFDAANRG